MNIETKPGVITTVSALIALGLAIVQIKSCLQDPPIPIEITRTVRDTIFVPIPEVRINYLPGKVIFIEKKDSIAWYSVWADTVSNKDTVYIRYNSPLPLSPKGYFSDLVIKQAPLEVKIDSTIITKLVMIDSAIEWYWVIITATLAFITGAIIF